MPSPPATTRAPVTPLAAPVGRRAAPLCYCLGLVLTTAAVFGCGDSKKPAAKKSTVAAVSPVVEAPTAAAPSPAPVAVVEPAKPKPVLHLDFKPFGLTANALPFDPKPVKQLGLDPDGHVHLLGEDGSSWLVDLTAASVVVTAAPAGLDPTEKAYRIGAADAWVLSPDAIGISPAAALVDEGFNKVVRRSLTLADVAGADPVKIIGFLNNGLVLAGAAKLYVVIDTAGVLTVERITLPPALFDARPEAAGLSADGKHLWVWTGAALRILLRALTPEVGADGKPLLPEWINPKLLLTLPKDTAMNAFVWTPDVVDTVTIQVKGSVFALTSGGPMVGKIVVDPDATAADTAATAAAAASPTAPAVSP